MWWWEEEGGEETVVKMTAEETTTMVETAMDLGGRWGRRGEDKIRRAAEKNKDSSCVRQNLRSPELHSQLIPLAEAKPVK